MSLQLFPQALANSVANLGGGEPSSGTADTLRHSDTGGGGRGGGGLEVEVLMLEQEVEEVGRYHYGQ